MFRKSVPHRFGNIAVMKLLIFSPAFFREKETIRINSVKFTGSSEELGSKMILPHPETILPLQNNY
ncbi:MAG: hypothetical protein JSU05_11635 [Bacteroidetes bacterium]|nr:hypothetical protein [Bacteroidota bacterium]